MIINRTKLAQHVMDAGKKLCLCTPPEGKMCDVRFVPHSCCLLSLTFLEHVPAQKWKKIQIFISHRLIHVQTCLIVTTTSVSTPPTHPSQKIHTIPTSYQTWQTIFLLPSSPFRTNNPLRPLRQHSKENLSAAITQITPPMQSQRPPFTKRQMECLDTHPSSYHHGIQGHANFVCTLLLP